MHIQSNIIITWLHDIVIKKKMNIRPALFLKSDGLHVD